MKKNLKLDQKYRRTKVEKQTTILRQATFWRTSDEENEIKLEFCSKKKMSMGTKCNICTMDHFI